MKQWLRKLFKRKYLLMSKITVVETYLVQFSQKIKYKTVSKIYIIINSKRIHTITTLLNVSPLIPWTRVLSQRARRLCGWSAHTHKLMHFSLAHTRTLYLYTGPLLCVRAWQCAWPDIGILIGHAFYVFIASPVRASYKCDNLCYDLPVPKGQEFYYR